MKKICLLLSIICLFSFVMASCSKTPEPDGNTTTDNSTTEAQTLSKEEQAELDEKCKAVETVVLKFMNAETKEEIEQCVVEYSDEYAEAILKEYANNDYTVAVERAGEYNHYEIFNIDAKSKSDAEFSVYNQVIVKKTEKGYLIENNEDVHNNIRISCACPSCAGTGQIVTVSGDCPACKGTAMVYDEKASFDPETNTWGGRFVDCETCKGTGKADNTAVRCETCDGFGSVFD